MYKHPLIGVGALCVACAIVTFIYYANADAAERAVQYIGAYVCVFLGALLTLVGLIVQGFKRLERLIVYRDMDMVEAGGFLGSTWDSHDIKKAHLSAERKALTP